MTSHNKISRRDLLKGLGIAALGATAFGFTSNRTRAQIAPTAQEIAAYYRFSLGEAEMIVISDAAFSFPPNFFGPEEEVIALLNELQIPLNAAGELAASVLNLVMIAGDTVAIFDTGNGVEAGGKLVPTLEALGIGTDGVTDVMMSHWHPDHINGLSTDGALVYPNAAVHFPQGDFDFLQNGPQDVVGGAVARLQPALDADIVNIYNHGDEVISGITSVGTPGHTPGHSAWLIESAGSQLIHFVDAVVTSYTAVARPEWPFSFDADVDMAVESRRMILEMAATDAIPVFGYHFTFPGTGYVRPDGDGFGFTPFAF